MIDRLMGFIVLFPLIVVVAVIAAFLPEGLQGFSGALVLVTGVYVYALSEKVGKRVKKAFKEKLLR
ncbi:MAG: hypothetical protein ABGX27_08965 [Desulfurobacteriaceae bacterium]